MVHSAVDCVGPELYAMPVDLVCKVISEHNVLAFKCLKSIPWNACNCGIFYCGVADVLETYAALVFFIGDGYSLCWVSCI